MIAFLVRRLLQAVFVVFVVTLLVAWAVRLSGDPAVMLTQGAGSVTADDLARIRTGLGLDRPFYAQYLGFVGGMLRGDMGRSFIGGTSVGLLIRNALPLTLLLAVVSLALSIAMSIPLGIHAAVRRGGVADQAIRVVSLVGLSLPNFWLGLMLVLVFGITLGWLPPSGADEAVGIVMPAATLAIVLTATNVRLVRSAMLDTLSQQYIMVARSKGVRQRAVLYHHALRNCAIPLVTYLGLQFGGLIGGVVVVERVFNWPGMGSLAFDAVASRDYPVLQAVVTVLAGLIVAGEPRRRRRLRAARPAHQDRVMRRLAGLELVVGGLLTATVVLLVLFSGVLFPDGGEAMDLAARLSPPGADWSHVLGTDPIGRDVLARVIVGGRVSLLIGVLSVAGGVVVGTFMGLVAGWYGRVWDTVVMRWADVQLALPFILVALVFVAILGASLWNLVAFMAITQWVQYARVVRGSVLSLREREFVQSARSFGVRDGPIMWHHLLPNAFGPVLILMTLNVANNILLESSLTFLGLGIDPTIPSWGGMLADGRSYMQTAWWVSVFPGLAIMVTVLGLNLLGDWLRDFLDPTAKG